MTRNEPEPNKIIKNTARDHMDTISQVNQKYIKGGLKFSQALRSQAGVFYYIHKLT